MLGVFLGEKYYEADGRYSRRFRLSINPGEAATARSQEADDNNQVAWMYDVAQQVQFALLGGNLVLWKPVGFYYFSLEGGELEGLRVAAETEARDQTMLSVDNNTKKEDSSSNGGGGVWGPPDVGFRNLISEQLL